MTGKIETQATDYSIQVKLNDQKISFQEQPYLSEGVTFVQLRPLFEALDIELRWDGENRVVHGSKEGLAFALPIGGKEAVVNNQTIVMDVTGVVRNNHTLVPVRLVSEAADVLVLWDPYTPTIFMYTDDFISQFNTNREEVRAEFQVYLQEAKERSEEEQSKQQQTEPDEKSDTTDEDFVPVTLQDLSHLKGMYYGYELDVGGYRCGGVCWPKYTFLDNQRIFVGEPDNGGVETLKCEELICPGYELIDGELVLDDGTALVIRLAEDGSPVINGVRLTAVEKVEDGYRLDGNYVNYGYGSAATWTETITFNEDGTFTQKALSGKYDISDNTITFTYSDGKVSSMLFFLHHGDTHALQINNRNFNKEE